MPASFDNIKDLMFVINIAPTTLVSQAGSTGTGSASNPLSIGGDVIGGGSVNSSTQITMQGFRASVSVDKGGGNMFGHLRAQIYGVSQSDMNDITTLQYKALTVQPNTISVYAIDGQQQTLVFQGNIVNAWGNYQSMPDVFLQIEAQAAYLNQLQVIGPSSYKGAADAATIMGNLAQQMGYQLENNNVQVQLSNPYLPGTGIDQARSLARAAGIWWGIDNNILWITPQYTARKSSGSVPEISPQSGLRGYPTFDGQGYINFECLFNPAITFLGHVQLVTSIPKASGQWTVVGINHRLEGNKPGGAWFSTIRVNSSGLVPTN